jgi:hypothetical protein
MEVITNKQATAKVKKLRETTGIDELTLMLCMAKKTVYVRMRTGEWKIQERLLIEKL